MKKTENTQKREAEPTHQPTNGIEGEGRYREANTAYNVREDWFFSFFFHRRSVCEVYGLETCIFSSFTNIEALTRNVDIVRIYCFLKNIFFFYKFCTR